MRSARLWRLAIALAFSGGLGWLLLRGVQASQVLALLKGASWPWLAPALVALALGYAARVRRWQLLLRHENPGVGWQQCAGPLLAGFALNNVLPFRAGDVLRCVAFSSGLGVSAGGAAATLLIERLLDVLMLVLALALAVAAFGIEGQRFFGLAAAAVAMAVAALLLLPSLRGMAAGAVVRLVGRVGRIRPSLAERLEREAALGLDLIRAARRRGALGPLLGWSLASWAAEGALFALAARALWALEFPDAAWLALPVATLGTLLPAAPGHLGTFDYFAAQAMVAGGNSAEAAAAYAMLVHALLWLPVTAVGGLWLWWRRS